MQAEDMLPDRQDWADLNGVAVRKGTVAAFLANARLWLDPLADGAARAAAQRDIMAAVPALRALGLFQVLAVRDPDLRKLVEQAASG
ncbi:hypothetical protein [Bordetella sp. BOR01]|uniref:hypothetical protein n=1 Tax=Bordetella sp. BOR01 TaxID=2854779 RepID=UPI001C4931E0|nr:hypothetical protein [Bordetella sp. BOR01]MBV7482652.1 hypothetical protein [Bordetella sp. BOR01]